MKESRSGVPQIVPIALVEICYQAKHSPHSMFIAINKITLVVVDPWMELVRLDRSLRACEAKVSAYHLANSKRGVGSFWGRVWLGVLMKRRDRAERRFHIYAKAFLTKSVRIQTVLMQKGDVWVDLPPRHLLEILERPIRWISACEQPR